MIDILRFGEEWCGPSRALANEMLKCQSAFSLVVVDPKVDTGPQQLYQVKSLPTLIFRKDGVEVARMTGRISAKKIDKKVREIQ